MYSISVHNDNIPISNQIGELVLGGIILFLFFPITGLLLTHIYLILINKTTNEQACYIYIYSYICIFVC